MWKRKGEGGGLSAGRMQIVKLEGKRYYRKRMLLPITISRELHRFGFDYKYDDYLIGCFRCDINLT